MNRPRVLGSAVAVALLLVLAAATPASAAAPESGSSDWRTVSVGLNQACGIRAPGRLYCWGADGDGELGDGGSDTDQPAPSLVAGGFTDWASISAGDGFACAIRRTGHLYCWGFDGQGQLGNGGALGGSSTPVEVAGHLAGWTAVTAGDAFACALRGGRAFCWGRDDHGQVGNGATTGDQQAPVAVAGGHTDWRSVSAGDAHVCGRRSPRATGGRLWCWGDDGFGQVGDGGTNTDRTAPHAIGASLDWSTVAAGAAHTCARRATGRVYCWGDDQDGQLGDGAPLANRAVPTLVAGGITNWVTVFVGGYDACARRANGVLECWGRATEGQTGTGSTIIGFLPDPAPISGGATDWSGGDSGGFTTCVRTTAGRLYCTGADDHGQLGNLAPNATELELTEVYVN